MEGLEGLLAAPEPPSPNCDDDLILVLRAIILQWTLDVCPLFIDYNGI
jgi:hypothetical protein